MQISVRLSLVCIFFFVLIIGLAKRVGARVLIASTSEIYGDPEVHPQPESYWGHVNPIGPRACYDEGKRVAETLSYAYAKQVFDYRLHLKGFFFWLIYYGLKGKHRSSRRQDIQHVWPKDAHERRASSQ